SEVLEGAEVPLTISLVNTGKVPVSVVARSPIDGSVEKASLDAGSSVDVKFTGVLPPGRYKLKPGVEYFDEYGNKYSAEAPAVEVVVKKREERPPPEEARGLDVGSLLDTVGKHALAFLVGSLTGRLAPETKRFEKPVYVQDVPHVKSGTTTLILDSPDAVVIEDRGNFVQIRKAKLVELLSSTSKRAARKLIGNFRVSIDGALKDWSPEVRREVATLLEKKFRDVSREIIAELAGQEKKKGAKVQADELAESLPQVFVLEYSYGYRGRLFSKVVLKVYAGAYARLERLHHYGADHEPLTLDEALRGLGLEEEYGRAAEHEAIFVLASPTDWSPDAKNVAQTLSGRVRLILINLKSGEAYYNAGDPLSQQLIQQLKIPAATPPLYAERLEQLDLSLLRGVIDESTYWSEVERVLRPLPQG
ncbi:MAG: hypothetical protein ABWK01_06675, partial [Infirmifilum sp.]